jgi:hypothetical protein
LAVSDEQPLGLNHESEGTTSVQRCRLLEDVSQRLERESGRNVGEKFRVIILATSVAPGREFSPPAPFKEGHRKKGGQCSAPGDVQHLGPLVVRTVARKSKPCDDLTVVDVFSPGPVRFVWVGCEVSCESLVESGGPTKGFEDWDVCLGRIGGESSMSHEALVCAAETAKENADREWVAIRSQARTPG